MNGGSTVQDLHTSRCFCCGARAFVPIENGWIKCTWCDIQIRDGSADRCLEMADQLRAFIHSDLARDMEQTEWRLTHRTLRIAATSWGLWYDPARSMPLEIVDSTSMLNLKPIDTFSRKPLSLVVIADCESNALHDMLDRYAALFYDVIVVLDTAGPAPRNIGNVQFYSRLLDGDFGAQRNAGNALAKGEWVFHLDTDETITPTFCKLLASLAGAADDAALRAVGFPRRNFVDGTVSDLFPDIQYRLMRRDVRFQNRVHERPDACNYAEQTIVSQHGTIDHFLSRDRILERSVLYDRLGQSSARHSDDRALLRPFEP